MFKNFFKNLLSNWSVGHTQDPYPLTQCYINVWFWPKLKDTKSVDVFPLHIWGVCDRNDALNQKTLECAENNEICEVSGFFLLYQRISSKIIWEIHIRFLFTVQKEDFLKCHYIHVIQTCKKGSRVHFNCVPKWKTNALGLPSNFIKRLLNVSYLSLIYLLIVIHLSCSVSGDNDK